ncbi:secreted RxLR effector protein 161-like [Vigna angularis]|uniref:secreted RxLR effector protein 161-like n=1 Tax=Phaseolus angularis TaxID=3914 RepID=UPI00080A0744|nr:secreted RxLR effector protein 161-like [Vigna angularis]
MDDVKDMKTPMNPTTSLGLDKSSTKLDNTLYRQMIGSLLFLIASRPYIMSSVCLCARFHSDPKETHLSAFKRIFQYLKGTTSLGLCYKRSESFDLKGYCDADFAGDKAERKSTSGSCHFIGGNLVSWLSKKQNTIAQSIAKVEYISYHFGKANVVVDALSRKKVQKASLMMKDLKLIEKLRDMNLGVQVKEGHIRCSYLAITSDFLKQIKTEQMMDHEL